MLLLRSRSILGSGFYKHFAPNGAADRLLSPVFLPVRDRTPQLDFLSIAHGPGEKRGAAGVKVWQLEIDLGEAVLICRRVEDEWTKA